MIDVAEVEHRVISQNLANVNTPGFRRLDVTFPEAVQRALQQGGQVPPDQLQVRIAPEEGLPVRADGNNVDMDRELGKLNQTALAHQTYAHLLATQLNQLRLAINGGR